MDVEPGDTVVVGETRYRVLGVSETHGVALYDTAMPNDMTYMPLASLDQEGVRVEKRKSGEP